MSKEQVENSGDLAHQGRQVPADGTDSRCPHTVLGRGDERCPGGREGRGLQFQDQKIQETQARLQALVREVAGSSSKSLLLQTVALFEALLARIKGLQAELAELSGKQVEVEKKGMDKGNRGGRDGVGNGTG